MRKPFKKAEQRKSQTESLNTAAGEGGHTETELAPEEKQEPETGSLLEEADAREIFKENMYPVELNLRNTIKYGFANDAIDQKMVYEARGAVALTIQIDCSTYRREDVYNAVKEICEKAVQYYEKIPKETL